MRIHLSTFLTTPLTQTIPRLTILPKGTAMTIVGDTQHASPANDTNDGTTADDTNHTNANTNFDKANP